MDLSERDLKHLWHPYTQMQTAPKPIAITHAKGVYLYDDKGNSYIDAISSWWTNLHGHSHPYIAQKVAIQLQRLEHVMFAGFTHQPAIELAERLLTKLPSNQNRIFYSDNGSTAVEVALKMALQYWSNKGEKRSKFIALKNAYHGDTFGAMSVSARSTFTNAFESLLFEVIYIDAPSEGKEQKSLDQLKSILKNNPDIAAIIVEPLVQGSAGMLMHKAEALDAIFKYCREQGVLTIADEVMTGFGRTGKFFASDYLSTKPDILCLSKGITGGTMAFGVTTSTEAIYTAFLSEDKLKTLFHGHSYTANPIACAAALASFDLMEQPETFENISRIAAQHTAFIKNHNSSKHQFRQCGTILAIELHTATGSSYLNPIRDQAYEYFIRHGILIRPLGNIIYLLPPYCITEAELNYIYKKINGFLELLLENSASDFIK